MLGNIGKSLGRFVKDSKILDGEVKKFASLTKGVDLKQLNGLFPKKQTKELLELQQKIQQHQQSTEALTKLLKAQHKAAEGIIKNIK